MEEPRDTYHEEKRYDEDAKIQDYEERVWHRRTPCGFTYDSFKYFSRGRTHDNKYYKRRHIIGN
jgi:hypothetical protein